MRRFGRIALQMVIVLPLLTVPLVPVAADHEPSPESHEAAGAGSLEGRELVEDQTGFPCFRVSRHLFGLRGAGTYQGRTATGGPVEFRGQIGAGETLYANGPLQVEVENTEVYYHSPFGTHGTESAGGAGCAPSTVGAAIPAMFRVFAAEGTVDADGDKDVDVLTGTAWVYRVNGAGQQVPCVAHGSYARGTNSNPAFGDTAEVMEWTLDEDCVVVGNEAGTPGTGTAPRGTFHTFHGVHEPCFGDVMAGDCPRNIRHDYSQFLPKPGPFLTVTGPATAVIGCDRPVTVYARLTVDGLAQPDVAVSFSVTGPAPATPPAGVGVTGPDGRAGFTFAAATPGDYTVRATVTYGGQQRVATHTVRFDQLPPLSVSLSGPPDGQTEEATTVTAIVSNACDTVSGAPVDFSVAFPAQDTPWTGQATPSSGRVSTDEHGRAQFSFSGDRAGDYRVTATASVGTRQASATHTIDLVINTMARVASNLIGADGETTPTVSAIDPAGEFAYFATGPGGVNSLTSFMDRIVKIDPATFETVDVLMVPGIRTLSIDPAGDYAYFTSGEGVNRIDLSTFELAGSIDLHDGGERSAITVAVIDPAGDYAYFGINGRYDEYSEDPSFNIPSRVTKVDLRTFEPVDTMDLATGGDEILQVALMDPAGVRAYFTAEGILPFGARVIAVDLATFRRVGASTLDGADEQLIVSGAIDPTGEHAYYGTRSSPGRIVKVNLDTLERIGAITLAEDRDTFGPYAVDWSEQNVTTAVMDPAGNYGYFTTIGRRDNGFPQAPAVPARIIRVDLDTFERAGSTEFPAATENLPRTAVIDPIGNHAYFGAAKTDDPAVYDHQLPGVVVKVALNRSPSPELVADAEAYATDFDTPLTVLAPGVLDGDTDADGDPLVAGQASDPVRGSVDLNPNGSFNYTPDAGFVGTDTFTYTASDGMDYSAPATVSVAVAPPEGLTGRGFGYHSSNMTLFGGAQPDIGPTPSVALAPDGSNSPRTATAATGTVAYGPAKLFTSGQIDVATSGRTGGSVTSTVTINDINTSRVEILGEDNYDCCDATGQVHQTPTPRPLTDISATCTATGTGRSASTTIANGWLYLDSGWSDGDAVYPEAAADAEGLAEHDPVKVALPTNPAPGTTHAGHIHLAGDSTDDYRVVLNEQITNADGSITVNAVHQHLGTAPPDILTGELVIGQAACGRPPGPTTNVAPDAAADAYATDQDTPTTVMAPGVLANDVDPDGDPLTAAVASGPANGTLALNANGSFTYTPTAGYSGPDAFTYTASDNNGGSDTATVALTVNPAATTVSIGDVAVAEGDAGTRAAVFSVSLSKPSASAVTVSYATANATASAGDYTSKSATLSLAAGVTNATLKVPITGDTVDEADESFTVVLSGATGAVIGDATGTATIVDDDPKTVTGLRLAVGDVAVHEGDAGARSAVFTVSLSKASTATVKVNFATAPGTALKKADFTTTTGTLTFAAGVTSMTVKVPIVADNLGEDDEVFAVNLSGASGATIADANGVGTVIDDD